MSPFELEEKHMAFGGPPLRVTLYWLDEGWGSDCPGSRRSHSPE
jgi:hypothetical protein